MRPKATLVFLPKADSDNSTFFAFPQAYKTRSRGRSSLWIMGTFQLNVTFPKHFPTALVVSVTSYPNLKLFNSNITDWF